MGNKILNKKALLALGLSITTFLSSSLSTHANSNNLSRKSINVKQETSMAPIVEVSKNQITFSTKMKGAIKIYLYSSPNHYNIGLNKPKEQKRVVSYSYPINKLKNKPYNAKIGTRFYISHQENGKILSKTKTFIIKDKYDKPTVEFKQRENKEQLAVFKISFPDNNNFGKTAITNQYPQLKVQSGSTTKTYVIKGDSKKAFELKNGKNEVETNDIEVKNGHLEYKVSKTTQNETEFKFTQIGKNFDSSDEIRSTYLVDRKETQELIKMMGNADEEIKLENGNMFETYAKQVAKLKITQEELDNINSGAGSLIRNILSDELNKERKEAIRKIEELKELDSKKKKEYIAKLSKFKNKSDKAKIDEIVKQACEEEKNLVNALKETAKGNINSLEHLTKEQKDGFIKRIMIAIDRAELDKIVQEARVKELENKRNQLANQSLKNIKDNAKQELLKKKSEIENSISNDKSLVDEEKQDLKLQLLKKLDELVKNIDLLNEENKINEVKNEGLKALNNIEVEEVEKIKIIAIDEIKFLTNLSEEKRTELKKSIIEVAKTKEEVSKIVSDAKADNELLGEEKELNVEKQKALKELKTLIYLTNKEEIKRQINNALNKSTIVKIMQYARNENTKLSMKKELDIYKEKVKLEIDSLTFVKDKNKIKENIDNAKTKIEVSKIVQKAKSENEGLKILNLIKEKNKGEIKKLINLTQEEIQTFIEKTNISNSINELNSILEEAKELSKNKEIKKDNESFDKDNQKPNKPSDTEKPNIPSKEDDKKQDKPSNNDNDDSKKNNKLELKVNSKSMKLFELNKNLENILNKKYKKYNYKTFDIFPIDSKGNKITTDKLQKVEVDLKDLGLNEQNKKDLSIYTNHKGDLYEVKNFSVKGSKVLFEWDKFSDFIFVLGNKKQENNIKNSKKINPTTNNPKTGDLGIAFEVSTLIIAGLGSVLLKKNRKLD